MLEPRRFEDLGDVWCWGSSHRGAHGAWDMESPTIEPQAIQMWVDDGQLQQPLKVKRLWSGPGASCGQIGDGIVSCWGEGEIGLSLNPDANSSRLRLNNFENNPALNQNHLTINEKLICAIDGGQVKCWGAPSALGRRELGIDNEEPVTIDLDGSSLDLPGAALALATRQVDLSDSQPEDPLPPALTCAVLDTGQLWCWGGSEHGLVDGGPNAPTPRQVQAGTIEDAVDVEIGEGKICVLRAGGYISCWGDDDLTSFEINPGFPGAPGGGDPSPRPSSQMALPDGPSNHSVKVGNSSSINAEDPQSQVRFVWRWQVDQEQAQALDSNVTGLLSDSISDRRRRQRRLLHRKSNGINCFGT